MRAMVLRQTRPAEENPLEPADVAEPVPAPGELRLRVAACGVCHTDLHVVEGDLRLPKLPLIPGHEIIGIVDQVGEGASQFSVGDRVGIPWLFRACGACVFCARGQENLCERAQFTGFHVDGGYAERVVVPDGFAYALPTALSDATAAAPLMCAGVIGYRALRLSDTQPGGRLGLYGFGASAHIAIQVALH